MKRKVPRILDQIVGKEKRGLTRVGQTNNGLYRFEPYIEVLLNTTKRRFIKNIKNEVGKDKYVEHIEKKLAEAENLYPNKENGFNLENRYKYLVRNLFSWPDTLEGKDYWKEVSERQLQFPIEPIMKIKTRKKYTRKVDLNEKKK